MHHSHYHLVATTVYFSKPSYAIQKSSSSEGIQIVLSNPLLFDLKITFTDDEGTATSKFIILMFLVIV